MTIDHALLTQLEIATQQMQRSQEALGSIRGRLSADSASPEVTAYLNGLHELLILTAEATRGIAAGLRGEFGQRSTSDEYQY